jgi:hypothetical protein
VCDDPCACGTYLGDTNDKARFDLAFVEQLQSEVDGLTLEVDDEGIALEPALLVLVELDLVLARIGVLAHDAALGHEGEELLLGRVQRQTAHVDRRRLAGRLGRAALALSLALLAAAARGGGDRQAGRGRSGHVGRDRRNVIIAQEDLLLERRLLLLSLLHPLSKII